MVALPDIHHGPFFIFILRCLFPFFLIRDGGSLNHVYDVLVVLVYALMMVG